MTREMYIENLKKRGYRVKENLTFINTAYGVWIQEIVEDAQGFGLVSVLNPCSGEPTFRLTDYGRRAVNDYIRELTAKRKEILDAGKDTADDTELPTLEVVEEDVNFLGIDDDGEYVNGWGVTDNYDADYPLLLKIGRDFEAVYPATAKEEIAC